MKVNMVIKKVIMTTMLGVMVVGFMGCSKNSSESLTLGFDDTFVPMGFKDENGEYTGFDIELAKAVGEKLGKEIKLQPIDWSMKETELNNKNIDFIWNGYSVTDERKDKVSFSKTYLNNRQIIITLAGSKIKTKADLKDAKVAAQNASSAVDAIEGDGNIKSTFKDGKIITFETNNEALMDLEAGRVDAVVADEILAKYYINGRGASKYNVISEDFGREDYAVGMRKDDSKFVDDFNKALNEVIADGTAAQISKKWFGEDIIAK